MQSQKYFRFYIPLIGFAFLLVLVAVALIGVSLRDNLIRSSALSYANMYVTTIEEFRALYTSEVISVLAQSSAIDVRHDYQSHVNAVPLPATLSMLLGEKIGQRVEGAKVKLYSRYPFPWREASGGLRDQFAEQAWQRLNAIPEDSYFEFIQKSEGLSLRFAKADVLKPGCVGCHNLHPDTPKNDWRAGDVRGVLEVDLPLDGLFVASLSELTESFMAYCGILLLVLLLILKIVGDLRAVSRRLQDEAEKLTAEVKIRAEAESYAQQSLRKAEQANSAKSVFLSTMSHELRTPMNAIIGFTGVLLRNYRHEDKQGVLLGRINSASKTLLSLINDILDLSKVESGNLSFVSQQFDFRNEVDAVLSLFFEQVEASQVGLNADIDSAIPKYLYGDPVRVRQVLTNIIGNAIKFTEVGSVTLSIEAGRLSKGWLILDMRVRDTGIGMSEPQISTIFSAFMQADESISERFGGTGLGLTISKRLIEYMGGEISVNSVPGEGSEFCFSICLAVDGHLASGSMPGRIVDAAGIDSAEFDNIKLQETELVEHQQESRAETIMAEVATEESAIASAIIDEFVAVEPRPEDAEFTAALINQGRASSEDKIQRQLSGGSHQDSHQNGYQESIRILLAEQYLKQQDITSILDAMGYVYQTAIDGREFIAQVEEQAYDLLLVGIELPELDAFEITQRVRNTEILKRIPIVGLANIKNQESAENCLLAGMTSYLVAPYQLADLEKVLIPLARRKYNDSLSTGL
ncbi:MAG: DUF3365 domain-containing protein [Pseudomonadales bacterium]|nr:DUF3365 domain-containing protein [Pseudomonadales bacterium]